MFDEGVDEGVVVFRGHFVFFLHSYYDQSKTCVENTNDAFLLLISNVWFFCSFVF